MNIAMVVYSHYSRDARVRRYAEALARRGNKVDVICLKEDYKPKETNISPVQYPLPRKRLGRLWYIWEYFLFFIYSSACLTFNHLRKKYQIIHIHNMPDVLVFTAITPKIFGVKIILDMHDPMPELYMSKYHADKSSLVVKILILLERVCFFFADYILTANHEFKKIFLSRSKISPHKISVVLNCPDPRIFNKQQITNNRQHFILFYMGTIDERFGLDIAIEAISLLKQKISEIKFIIIPKLEEEGGYFELLKEKIINLCLENYISIQRPLPLEKVAKEIGRADIGIVLAKNGVFTDSIIPVKLLEFIQMGVPVIATRTKILSKYFSEKSLYFLKKNTVEEFTQAVLTLRKNSQLRSSFSNEAKKYLEKNNWIEEEKRYLKLIELLR